MAIEVQSFRSYQKNTLQGFATIRLSNIGLEIRDVCLHEKDGKRWIQLPAKPYQKTDGKQGWTYILDFYDKARAEQFQKLALQALDIYLRGGRSDGL